MPTKQTLKTRKGTKPSKGLIKSAPVARQRIETTRTARMKSVPGGMVISHREYVGDVLGSVAFAATKYELNPGLSATFPWLATVANRFESYSFDSLSFDFETTSATSAIGSAMSAFEYDATESEPTTKQHMMAYAGARRGAPWEEFRMASTKVLLNKIGPTRFVRGSAIATNSDKKLYDAGFYIFATSGCADASAVGELYVNYTIRLMTPQIAISELPDAVSQRWFGTTPTTANEFGTMADNTGTVIVTVGTNGVLTFVVPGRYLVLCQWLTSTSYVLTNPTVAGGGTLDTSYFQSGYLLSGNSTTNTSSAVVVDVVAGSTLTYVATVTAGLTAELNITAIGRDSFESKAQSSNGSTDTSKRIELLERKLANIDRAVMRMPSVAPNHAFRDEPAVDLTASIALTPEEKSSGAWYKVR